MSNERVPKIKLGHILAIMCRLVCPRFQNPTCPDVELQAAATFNNDGLKEIYLDPLACSKMSLGTPNVVCKGAPMVDVPTIFVPVFSPISSGQ